MTNFNFLALKHKTATFISLLATLLLATTAQSQELLAPLSSRGIIHCTKQQTPKIGAALELPFFDDFSDYEGTPDPSKWSSQQAFVNKDYAPEAPTVGMATLDALDANGNLSPHASTNLFTADTLTSRVIRLDSLTGTYHQRLQPSDSIILSFYYLPGGWYGNNWELVGDTPSGQDSLFLDFYDALADQWVAVWATPGFAPDTTGRRCRWPWHYASVKIDDERYLTNQFMFRFRNYASLDHNPKSGIAGNCDQWNLDYIYLNSNRSAADSFFRDVAFVEKAPSMLEHYQAMPARQFRASDMAQRLSMKMVNRYNQTLASKYAYDIYNAQNEHVGGYQGGFENIPAFFPNGLFQQNALHCSPPVNYTFPQDNQRTEFHIVHVVSEGVGGDQHTCNDTVTFIQHFSNFYAYDDGIPENGYGLTSPSSRMWMALRFDIATEDTLTAVDILFNRTRNAENEDIPFQLCVWNCENGRPSDLIYKDEVRQHPQFDGMNRFHRFPLSSSQIVDDTIFVGLEQLNNGFINIGFDRSNDARQYTFSRTNNEWVMSYLRGAVMLRPVFGSEALVAIPVIVERTPEAKVFPNPSNGCFTIETAATTASPSQMQLLDIHGRTVMSETINSQQHTVCDPTLRPGVYIIRLIDITTGSTTAKKIVIK